MVKPYSTHKVRYSRLYRPRRGTSVVHSVHTLVHIVHVALALRCRLVRLRAPPAVDAAVLEVDVGRGVVVLHGRHPVLGADELEHEVAQRARLREREAELAASRTARAGACQRRLLLLGRLGLVVDRVEAEPRDREEPLG